ncbi:glycosyltransferase [Microbacterium sp. C7(2022)]|uniref:glycosyltransferase n=1 Tax=Microbacterium sp. C7(2022) TaxID=2992759 RepID=UPI00237C3785|nr:glycosyltransferase [Microbacterium sp. C7(2022)]MDE0547315.1 glycosyltransferase [Microbacterium sp. C7(2022)]
MPARVHAVIVVRPDGRTPAALHVRRTLSALRAQRTPVARTTIVTCFGEDAEVAAALDEFRVDEVVSLPASTGYATAVDAAVEAAPTTDDALWLLAQDTAPDVDALTHLSEALERSPSVAFVAPKLVRWNDRSRFVSMGVSMTRWGATVDYAAGQLDQGQHDAHEDVMGADVRGLLVRVSAWRELEGLDPALLGADQGLDLGVRARLAGGRVAVAPRACVATSGDGVAGVPAPLSAARRQRAALITRTAQLHRRLAYARVYIAPLVWLSILPLAVWRTVLLLFRKQPLLIGPEWAASFIAIGRPFALIRSRRRLKAVKRVPWSQLTPLRVTGSQLRSAFGVDEHGDTPGGAVRTELRFFAGGGAWLVLGALITSLAAFPALLAWPVLGGGALQPLRSTVERLWSDAAYGQRNLGWDLVAPADPFSSLIALVGSATPWSPSQAIVALWILALPLAALGGWFAATRVTERAGLRIVGGTLWALTPTFLVALVDGRPTAVLTHLLLPWLFYAASVAHRSWAAAGAASVLLVGVLAASPSVGPAVVVIWLGVLILVLAARNGRGTSRLIWLLVPTAVFFAPLIWHAIAVGDGWALIADPGVVWAGPQVEPTASGRALLAAGIPTDDIAGWVGFLSGAPSWWVPLLAAPLALVALAAPLTQRWAAGILLLGVAATGLATAFAAVGVAVQFTQSETVALWPGSGLSLAWLAAIGAALVTVDAGVAPRGNIVRASVAAVVVVGIAVLAIPSLTALARGVATIDRGDASTLPAYVAVEGDDDPDVGTVILSPQDDGGLAATFVWGGSETLGGQSTVADTRTALGPDDVRIGGLAADLVTSGDNAPVEDLADHGISFVLLAPGSDDEAPAARTMRLEAATALNQRESLEAVGETEKGLLWRVSIPVAERSPESADVTRIAGVIMALQIGVLGIALLLAVPTSVTRREARRLPRVVGPYWQEGR